MFRRGLQRAEAASGGAEHKWDRVRTFVTELADRLQAVQNDTFVATIYVPTIEILHWAIVKADIRNFVLVQARNEQMNDDWWFRISFRDAAERPNFTRIQLEMQKKLSATQAVSLDEAVPDLA